MKIQKRPGRISVGVTGTPGTGKSTACALLSGVTVVDLNALAREHSDSMSCAASTDTIEVDPRVLRKLLPVCVGTVVLEGHLAHLLDPDMVIVLRCSPKVLGERLRDRGWPREKMRENQEAEAVDVILIEALERNETVFEIDTTHLSPEDVAAAITEIMGGERRKYAPGDIDWSEEVLEWY